MKRTPAAATAPQAVSPRRILVVDDYPTVAESLSKMLQLKGHEVKTTFDGPSALEVVSTFRPEVILLDIGLPGMDGYELAERIRKDAETAAVLLIAMTGYGQDEDRQRSQSAGFDYHLTKPVDHTTLFDLIASDGTKPRHLAAGSPRFSRSGFPASP